MAIALLVDEHLDLFDSPGVIVQTVEQVHITELGFEGEEGKARVLGAIAKGRVGNALRVRDAALWGQAHARASDGQRRKAAFVVVVAAFWIDGAEGVCAVARGKRFRARVDDLHVMGRADSLEGARQVAVGYVGSSDGVQDVAVQRLQGMDAEMSQPSGELLA